MSKFSVLALFMGFALVSAVSFAAPKVTAKQVASVVSQRIGTGFTGKDGCTVTVKESFDANDTLTVIVKNPQAYSEAQRYAEITITNKMEALTLDTYMDGRMIRIFSSNPSVNKIVKKDQRMINFNSDTTGKDIVSVDYVSRGNPTGATGGASCERN